jgi:hypothetical protein
MVGLIYGGDTAKLRIPVYHGNRESEAFVGLLWPYYSVNLLYTPQPIIFINNAKHGPDLLIEPSK